MSTKVLVFESDAGFAGELRNELGKLGCMTSVVDDGNVGLQHASTEKPDLILLSIELPRMNGFSVCNKLKKDPNLKDVPLIIMSSESSDETFEQHKKLRTRAEDYVHKPIAFGDLLEHIQAFVSLGTVGPDSEAAIVIDDEIEIGSTDYYSDEDGTVVAPRSPAVEAALEAAVAAQKNVDADVDAFAESAFGMLTTAPNGAPEPAAVVPVPSAASIPPMQAPPRRASVAPARSSVRPSASTTGVDAAELERVRDELVKARDDASKARDELARSRDELAKGRDEQTKARERLAKAERDLGEVRGEVDRLELEAGEAERLTREVEDLKARLAAGPKAGAVSSREFLDLREALNKKDKEILALKEQLSRKDKEIVESQDKMISLERSKADLDDRGLATERELAEARDKIESLAADKDLAKKVGEDLKGRLEKAKSEIEGRERQLADTKARHADELVARDATLAQTKAHADEELAKVRASHAGELEQAEARRRTDLDSASREQEAALAEAQDRAAHEKSQALAAQEAELRQQHEGKVSALQGAHAEEVERRLAQAHEEAQGALDALRVTHAQRIADVESDRASRIAALEEKGAQDRNEAEGRIARVDGELAATRSELDSVRQAKQAAEAAAELKVLDLENRLAESLVAREELEKSLGASNGRVAALDGELSASQQDLADARQRLATESARADRSVAKWDADRQSLERAKDALAVALAQIEEAEART